MFAGYYKFNLWQSCNEQQPHVSYLENVESLLESKRL